MRPNSRAGGDQTSPGSAMPAGTGDAPAGMHPQSAAHNCPAGADARRPGSCPGGGRRSGGDLRADIVTSRWCTTIEGPGTTLDFASGNARKMHLSGFRGRRLRAAAAANPDSSRLMAGQRDAASGGGAGPRDGMDHPNALLDEQQRTSGVALRQPPGSSPAGAGDGPRAGHLSVQRHPELDNDLSARAAVGDRPPRAAAATGRWRAGTSTARAGPAFHTNLVRVNPGNVLVGVIAADRPIGLSVQLRPANSSGIANTRPAESANVQELTWNIQTLEAYGVQQCSDYPNTNFHRLLRDRFSGPVPAAPRSPGRR